MPRLSFFLMTTVLATLALWRTKTPIRKFPSRGAAAYLALVVVLTKSAGSLLYMITAGLLVAQHAPNDYADSNRAGDDRTGLSFAPRSGSFPNRQLVGMASAVNEGTRLLFEDPL